MEINADEIEPLIGGLEEMHGVVEHYLDGQTREVALRATVDPVHRRHLAPQSADTPRETPARRAKVEHTPSLIPLTLLQHSAHAAFWHLPTWHSPLTSAASQPSVALEDALAIGDLVVTRRRLTISEDHTASLKIFKVWVRHSECVAEVVPPRRCSALNQPEIQRLLESAPERKLREGYRHGAVPLEGRRYNTLFGHIVDPVVGNGERLLAHDIKHVVDVCQPRWKGHKAGVEREGPIDLSLVRTVDVRSVGD